jgi:hypothetical protein
VPPVVDAGLRVVVVAVTISGARGGRRTRSGVTGRIRGAVESFRGSEYARTRAAAVAGSLTAAGYAAGGVVAGLWLGTQAATELVGGLVYGLVVGVPAAVAAVLY